MNAQRTAGLEAVIYYKLFVAGLLAATAIALLSTSFNSSKLEVIADSGLFETHFWLINRGLDHILHLSQKTMQVIGLVTGMYASLVLVQAIGLWRNRTWAKQLVLVTAGTSLPLELYELGHGFTPLKIGLLMIHAIIFGYFWKHLKICP